MHGQESDSDVKDKTEIINLKQLKNKNIDYLALGHIHKYKQEKLDNRGIYCYSGCLEGRGFDECGEKGFVLLDVENGKIQTTFIPCSQRILCEVYVDITGATQTNEIEEKIKEQIKEIPKTSLVKIILTGEVELGSERDIKYLTQKIKDYFYFVKIYDRPKIKIDYMKWQYDVSLKGEFIRLVLKQDLTDEEKNKIISTGIKALSGEEL
jgi:DNA repair exonuclease SbcCD nuclease subunit